MRLLPLHICRCQPPSASRLTIPSWVTPCKHQPFLLCIGFHSLFLKYALVSYPSLTSQCQYYCSPEPFLRCVPTCVAVWCLTEQASQLRAAERVECCCRAEERLRLEALRDGQAAAAAAAQPIAAKGKPVKPDPKVTALKPIPHVQNAVQHASKGSDLLTKTSCIKRSRPKSGLMLCRLNEVVACGCAGQGSCQTRSAEKAQPHS